MKKSEVFAVARGTKPKPLALHPSAIGVAYPQVDALVVADVIDGVAILEVEGPLSHKGYSWCGLNYESLYASFVCCLIDDSVSAVILKFNSPGGEVSGLFETVRLMIEAKDKSGKNVVAYVDEDCYSAAYAIAMVADEVIVPTTGNVGSIGVITVMAEMTKADEKDGFRFEVISSGSKKADGHPHVELTDDAIERTQSKVDALAVMFFDLVESVRGLDAGIVQGFEAGTFTGEDAVKAGLADSVMPFNELLTLAKKEFKPTGTTMGLIANSKSLADAKTKFSALVKSGASDDKLLAAAAEVTKAEIKYRHVKKTVETIESEDEKDMPASESEEEEEKDDKEEDAKAASATSTATDIASVAKRLTGKSSDEEVIGALHAMSNSGPSLASLQSELAELKAEKARSDIMTLVAAGVKAGKISPAQKKWALSQTKKTLEAYLEATPKMVHTLDDEAAPAGKTDAVVSAEMAKIWTKQGFKPADFPKLLEKINGAGR